MAIKLLEQQLSEPDEKLLHDFFQTASQLASLNYRGRVLGGSFDDFRKVRREEIDDLYFQRVIDMGIYKKLVKMNYTK